MLAAVQLQKRGNIDRIHEVYLTMYKVKLRGETIQLQKRWNIDRIHKVYLTMYKVKLRGDALVNTFKNQVKD